MREKLKDSGGFTLVEMLCAVAILVLLCLMLNTGLQMAVRTYRAITAESETQLLLNTLMDAIADELRYAHDVTPASGNAQSDFTYNGGRSLKIAEDRVVVDLGTDSKTELLPTGKTDDDGTPGKGGAYHGGAYRAEQVQVEGSDGVKKQKLFITYDKDTECFTIHLKVVWRDGDISAETPKDGVTIRCLNPPAKQGPAEAGGETAP